MEHLQQPSRRNWKLYGWVVVGIASFVILVVFLAINGSKPPPKEDKIATRSIEEQMPSRTFNPPPKPEPPAPVVLPASAPAVEKLPEKPPAPVAPQKPIVEDKPMISRFAAGEDAKAYADSQKFTDDVEQDPCKEFINGILPCSCPRTTFVCDLRR